MCSGGARGAIGEATAYAAQRRQFGQPIATFGAIRHKLGEMTIREYAVESMLYRTAGLIDARRSRARTTAVRRWRRSRSSPSRRPSLKVAASEMLDFVLDENVQIHGGNGFVHDYPAERHYRDARVNRIFEGTNEINRLLIPGMLARRAVKGDMPLIPAARRLQDEILTPGFRRGRRRSVRRPSGRTVAAMKKVALMVLGTAMQTYGDKLSEQQEVLSTARTSSSTSMPRKALSCAQRSRRTNCRRRQRRSSLPTTPRRPRRDRRARTALAAMSEGDTLRTLLAALRRRAEESRRSIPSRCAAPSPMRPRAAEGISFLARGYVFEILHIVLALLGVLGIAACTVREVPYEDEIAAWRIRQGPLHARVLGVAGGRQRTGGISAADILSDQPGIPCAGVRSTSAASTTSSRCRRQPARSAGCSASARSRFTLKGQPLKLTAFAEENDAQLRRLFVPFRDLTNGSETYPAGRYLDLERTATGVYDLDFNRAYHPFCLFNATYDCPVPPRENRLPMPSDSGRRSKLGEPHKVIRRDRLRFRRRPGRLRATAPARLPGVLEALGFSLPREKYYSTYLGYDDAGVFRQWLRRATGRSTIRNCRR